MSQFVEPAAGDGGGADAGGLPAIADAVHVVEHGPANEDEVVAAEDAALELLEGDDAVELAADVAEDRIVEHNNEQVQKMKKDLFGSIHNCWGQNVFFDILNDGAAGH